MDSSGDDLNVSQALGRKKRYKDLIDRSREIGKMIQEPGTSTTDTLREIQGLLRQSDDVIDEGSITDRAEHSTELVLDAQLLHMSTGLVSKYFQKSTLSTSFTAHEYQNAINQLIARGETDDWYEITKIACQIARTARAKSTMLGAVKVEPRQRIVKERQARRKTTQAEEQRPETINKLHRHDKGAEKVNIVYKQLIQIFKENNLQPIPFYKLVIDPNNFMNTVENAFQIAFLVHDNRIVIETGEDTYPQVRLIRPDERDLKKETAQSICSLNIGLCQEMIVLYDIKEAMLVVATEEEEN